MHPEALAGDTRALFERSLGASALAPFTLVGGTALALQIGHRQSLDLDLATFDEQSRKQRSSKSPSSASGFATA